MRISPRLRSALRRLAAEHPILAMPMQDPADREASERIVDGIEGATVMPPDSDLEAQLAAIGGSALVIGMRLHALILAAAAHVPALAISYDPKVDAFAAQVGQPVVGRVGEPMDEEALVAAARTALDTDPAPYIARVEELRSRIGPDAAAALAALRRPG